MSEQRELDRLLDHWFSDGPNEVPDRVIDAVADRIGRQSQRPAWRLDWRTVQMNRTIGAAAAAAAIVVVGLVGLRLLGGGNPSVGGPTPRPIESAASESASAAAEVPKACDLVTPNEVGAAMNLSSAVSSGPASGSNSEVDYCIYRSAGAEVLGLTYRNTGGAAVFDVWSKASGVQAVSGLGDKAIWDPGQTALFILKGSRLVEIEGGSGPNQLTLEKASAVGAIAADRM